jgi:hypothetical protein
LTTIWGITTDEFWNGLRAVSVFDDDTADAQCSQGRVGIGGLLAIKSTKV